MADLSKHTPYSPIVKSEHILVWNMWICRTFKMYLYVLGIARDSACARSER